MEVVRSDRIGGKRKQIYVARLGTIRSCCLANRSLAAIEETAAEFIAVATLKLLELAEADRIPPEWDLLRRLQSQIDRGLTDLLPDRWPDVASTRERRWQRRVERAKRRGEEIKPKLVAQWSPHEQWVFSRAECGPDHEWHRPPLKQPTPEQHSSRKIEHLLINLRGESGLTEERREGIRILFGAPRYAELTTGVAGALKDLLAAADGERFCAAKRELGAANNCVAMRTTVDKIHKLIPSEERATAFDRLVECVQGSPVFAERLVDDLELMSKPESYLLRQSFAGRADRKDDSKITREEWDNVNKATGTSRDVPTRLTEGMSWRLKEAWREFHHVRCMTQQHSLEFAGRNKKFSFSDQLGPEQQAILNEEIRVHFSVVEALIAVHHHFGKMSQAETAKIVLPDRTPEAGRRAVSRIYARLRPKIQSFGMRAA